MTIALTVKDILALCLYGTVEKAFVDPTESRECAFDIRPYAFCA